jgi:hypothetical protein
MCKVTYKGEAVGVWTPDTGIVLAHGNGCTAGLVEGAPCVEGCPAGAWARAQAEDPEGAWAVATGVDPAVLQRARCVLGVPGKRPRALRGQALVDAGTYALYEDGPAVPPDAAPALGEAWGVLA